MSHQFIPAVLAGDLVRLEPLSPEHVPGLELAAEGARATPSYATVPTPAGVRAYVEHNLQRQAGGGYLPFAQVEVASGRILGHTAFLTPRTWPDGHLLAVEVGSSWLAPDMRGTAVNSASKMLLLAHAFDDWQVERVDIKTDVRNSAARAGIRAVGARFEGILRNWQPSLADGEEGRPRDTAMFSVTATEWPGVRAHLQERITTKLAARG